MWSETLAALNFADGLPASKGQIKHSPDDFKVEENLGFELSGEGEHLFLLIEKKLLNTEDMLKIIAHQFKLPYKSISYAGLKDKFATTIQWFSVHLPGITDPDLSCLNAENHRLLKAMRHNKKLKVGALKENHFHIKIHDFVYDEQELNTRIETIKSYGVPNYFGLQRFGNQGRNLDRAGELLLENKKIKDRHLRGIYYSAARSFLFNLILHTRINEGCWNVAVAGDLMMLAGSHSVFAIDAVTDEIKDRVIEHDIFPAAPLWGVGSELLHANALQLQTSALEPWRQWCTSLERHGLQKLYRSLVLMPKTLQFADNTFSFSLPPGAYATTVLRELVNTSTASGEDV